jgi:5-methylcytosine-specific restriction protein B
VSDTSRREFKNWLLATGKKPNTVSVYFSGVNTVSKHLNKDVFEICDSDELAGIYKLYGPQGEHARIGTRNSSNVHNGLKQWMGYQEQLTVPGSVEAAKGMVDRSYTPALNQIFYGPPGTGKTYATIDAALEILDPECLIENGENREKLKNRFDELSTDGQIRFVTFHQSFSYEDFVEGLRAVSDDEDKQLQYNVEPGVFKRLCDDARTQGVQSETGIRSNPRIWKISINGSGNSHTKSYCLDNGEARIGWGKTGDLRQDPDQNTYYRNLGSGDKGTLSYFAGEMVVGDILLCIHSADQIGAVGVVTSDYRYEEHTPAGVFSDYQHVRSVNWLYREVKQSILPLNDNRQFTLKTVYPMGRFGWADLLGYLEKQGVTPQEPSIATSKQRKPHVLIIDEINRGNVSRIFGELITLIEPSKREGAAEALSVELPYSKRPFNVPGNVYLIGTMNTADRSLSGLDIALRRRFNFREMPPQPELLDDLTVEGVNIGQLLRVMNQRIEVLLDRDHCLGHAYFMSLKADDPLEKLEVIFRNQILPLLQEYFFEDWQRIQWVLNDHRKSAVDRFVYQRQRDVQSLFGANVNVSAHNLPWTINDAAFERVSAYTGIIKVQATVEDIMETLMGEEA